jgi:AcrR family transcriptional regulator
MNESSLHQFLPRRSPRQKRSRLLYDKIVVTARKLFEEEGFAYVTTNKIADKSNISIGSLYQYFKNCESIALAVYEDACGKAALTMKRMTLDSLGVPLEKSIPKHIERVFELFENDHYALIGIIREVPELRRVAQPLSFGSLISHMTQLFLEQHFPTVDRATIARKAYVVDKAVLGVTSRYLEETPDFLKKKEIIAEIVLLIEQYLRTLSDARESARSTSGST